MAAIADSGKGQPRMDETTQNHDTATDVIREVCQQNTAEPEAIWEALEAKGIDTTPGVVYQALTSANGGEETAAPAQVSKAAGQAGLTAEDLTVLGTLAVKAGGVERLLRILAVWQETPK